MNKVVEPDFEELGAQLGRALRSRVAAQRFTLPQLEPVHAGARRRRAVHRSGVVLVCVALIAAAGFALTRRTNGSVPGDDGGAGVVRPSMLPAYAILDGAPGIDGPVSMWAEHGGQPMGTTVPQIDVWGAGDHRLIIRSVDNSTALPAPGVTTTSAVATTAVATGPSRPWADHPVTELQVRGVAGAIEELAADQYAVWIPTSSADKYTVVIGRGTTRDQVLADVESLADVDGVLQPPSGFVLVDSAAAQPASVPSPAVATVSYGYTDGPFVSTNMPPAGRSSIETVNWGTIGRLDRVAGRDVIVVDGHLGNQPTITWLDPSGVVVNINRQSGQLADLIPYVRMIPESQFVTAGEAVSHGASSLTEVDHVFVGDVVLTRRHGSESRALCVTAGAAQEECGARPARDESPESAMAEALIDGHWVIFGYRQILPDDVWPAGFTADDVKFTSTDGSCCKVEMTKQQDAYWYVVHVDDDVDLVDTNVGDVFGGIIGTISRPLVASAS